MLSVNLQKFPPARFIQSVCVNIANSRVKKTALVASAALGLYFTVFSKFDKYDLKANAEFYYFKLRAMFGKEDDWLNYAQHCNYYPGRYLKEQLTYLKRAAEAGLPEAQHEFVNLCLRGEIQEEYGLCREYFEKLVNNTAYLEKLKTENIYALINIYSEYAKMYHKGLGGAKDLDKAIELLIEAAKLDSSSAQFQLATLYKERAKLNQETSFEDYKSARKSFKELADNHEHNPARYEYAFLCYKGRGGGQNLEEARRYFKLSAEAMCSSACYFYARMCYDGDGGERNFSEALKYIEISFRRGDKRAPLLLALVLRKEGEHQDMFRARDILKKQKDSNTTCLYYYGFMCREGQGGLQDNEEALKSYIKVLSSTTTTLKTQGLAAYQLADLINEGLVTNEKYQGNFQYALLCAEKALENKVDGAQNLIAKLKAKV